jgi:hypothetical protein
MATVRTRTGVELDESNPEDAKILRRQRAVARRRGVLHGLHTENSPYEKPDRQAVTGGRQDLEEAFDEGAAQRDRLRQEALDAQPDADEESEDEKPQEDGDTRGQRTRAAAEGGPALSAGLVLGFLAYSAFIQIFQGGMAQLNGWIKAKLINEPYQPPGGGG